MNLYEHIPSDLVASRRLSVNFLCTKHNALIRNIYPFALCIAALLMFTTSLSCTETLIDVTESLLADQTVADEAPEEICDIGSSTMGASARTSQGAGIGYTHGYTTIDGFFSMRHCHEGWSPFLDLRGHIFNNNRYAANAGIGFRYLTETIALGMNSYYDYRNTHEFHYNQWGLGLEAIGSFWSFNVNGYLPVGRKRSHLFGAGISGTASAPSFGFFQGNQFFITLSGSQALFAKQEFALKGIDAKFLMRLTQKSIFSLDGSIGPYYYQGYFDKFAVGGEASLIARIGDYVTLNATGSYDNLFHERGHLGIGFSIPFGPKNFSKECNAKQPCSIPSFFNTRVTRGANRNEIIVLDKHELVLATATAGGTEVAINPSTGQPYVVWFVNNLSSSSGTYESPYKTIQDALAVAQADDMIYVYAGDGSAYDVDIPLLNGQLFLGSGINQIVATQFGNISIPAQSATSPSLENSMGATMITVADRNIVSGFTLNVLSAGDTVVASAIDSLSFLNNIFNTSVTTGMNNLVFTDATGTLLVQNNKFIMDPLDTGSLGVRLSDSGSGSSTLSIISNTFTNHASRPISLNYSGSSSPTLDIAANSFTPPSGSSGINAIDLATSNATVLAGSISNGNTFSAYTGNTINMNWTGSGSHELTISSNIITSDPTISGTNGVSLNTSTSGTSSITVTNNTFTDQTNTGVGCYAASNAIMNVNISGNTITGYATPGNNGIQIGATDTSIVTGSITYNTCSEHLGGDINGFPSTSGTYTLTIAHNTLTGPSTVPGGSYPNGIQFSANGACVMSFNINHNQLTNHADHGINLFGSDTATITSTINNNTLTVPDSWLNTAGIQVSAGNSSAVTSTHSITNNVCTGHTNANIQSSPNMDSILYVNVSGNTLSGPTSTPGGANPSGIQMNASNSAILTAIINGHNQCSNHINRAMNLFSSDAAQMIVTIDENTISTPISTAATSGISVGGSNSSASPASSYTITNNICTGANNGTIQCFPSNNLNCSLVISNNTMTSATNGISGSGPAGIQVGLNNSSAITSLTISNNTWTSPHTYQASGSPQGMSIGASNTASLSNVTISNNILNFPITSYADNTGTTGISTYLNDTALFSGLSVLNNTVTYSTHNYANNTSPGGISVSADGGALTDVTISHNLISFASLPAALASFQEGGINCGGSGSAIVGTALSPAIISYNTITGIEGNAITLLNASSGDTYINATNNTISLGTVMKSELGVVTVPFSTGKLITVIDSNTIEGNNGGFVGIVATNQGPVCQSVTISNNTVTNVHGNNPALPLAGLGGGIGSAILSTGDLNVFVVNNGVSGNTPQGIFGFDSAALMGSGTICIRLQNNHGAGAAAPDNYVLYNPTMAPASTFIYQDAGGNLGTLSFSPSMSDFTAGTCTSCP